MNIGFWRGAVGLVLLCWVCIAPAAQAQLFADDAARELARKNEEAIATMQALLRELNADIENARQQNSALTQKNQNLEAQVRGLNGQIEELQRQLSVSRNENAAEQRAQLVMQEKKIAELENAVVHLQTRLSEMSQFITVPPEDKLYGEAYAAYQQGDYANAIIGFNRVLDFYPSGQFSANCRYWLGQAYLTQRDYVAASENAQKLLDDYPQSDKTPEALLILAKSYQGMELIDEMQRQLQVLIDRYPTSLAADSARQLLVQ